MKFDITIPVIMMNRFIPMYPREIGEKNKLLNSSRVYLLFSLDEKVRARMAPGMNKASPQTSQRLIVSFR
jgi:hypothetical protein